MPTLWSDLLKGKTAAQVLADLLASIQGIGFPIDDWEDGAVVRTILDVALSPALSAIWDAIAGIAQGGFIRLAQALAEADIAGWNADPTGTWLYLLATQLYNVTPTPPAFTVGLLRFVNGTGNTYSVTTSTVVTVDGVRYAATKAVPLPPTIFPSTGTWIEVKAQLSGPVGNTPINHPGTLNVSLPGVTVSTTPRPPSTAWITTFGTARESPSGVANRCVARWGRLAVLQTDTADGYRSLALDASPNVKKVAIWSNYNPDKASFEANAVTVYLGSDSGPVDAATVAIVDAAMRPYIGICDVLYTRACGQITWSPVATIWCDSATVIPQVKTAIELKRQALQTALDIGQEVLDFAFNRAADVPGVADVSDDDTGFVPPNNALITVDFSKLIYMVQP